MKTKRKEYEEKLDAQYEKWNVQIAMFRAKAEKANAGAKIEYFKTIDALQKKQSGAAAKLNELKTSGNEAWEDLKTGAENAWGEVKSAFQSATEKFK
ncbi:MAG: coiled coil domain-containing protein [Pseudomonadota bacterium]